MNAVLVIIRTEILNIVCRDVDDEESQKCVIHIVELFDGTGMETSDLLLVAGTLWTICSGGRLSQAVAAARCNHSRALTILHCLHRPLLMITTQQNYAQNLLILTHTGDVRCMLRRTTTECRYNFTGSNAIHLSHLKNNSFNCICCLYIRSVCK